MTILRSRLFVACIAVVATSLVVGGIAFALQSPVDGSGVVHACYNASTGAVILNVKGSCPSSGDTTPITWNAQGQPGPPGATGPQGPAGPGAFTELTGDLYVNDVSVPFGSCVQLVTPPTGMGVVITNIHAGAGSATPTPVRLFRDASCSTSPVDVIYPSITGNATSGFSAVGELQYGAGLPVPPGSALYASYGSVSAGGSADVAASGYVSPS
jgi:hypothetical protein